MQTAARRPDGSTATRMPGPAFDGRCAGQQATHCRADRCDHAGVSTAFRLEPRRARGTYDRGSAVAARNPPSAGGWCEACGHIAAAGRCGGMKRGTELVVREDVSERLARWPVAPIPAPATNIRSGVLRASPRFSGGDLEIADFPRFSAHSSRRHSPAGNPNAFGHTLDRRSSTREPP